MKTSELVARKVELAKNPKNVVINPNPANSMEVGEIVATKVIDSEDIVNEVAIPIKDKETGIKKTLYLHRLKTELSDMVEYNHSTPYSPSQVVNLVVTGTEYEGKKGKKFVATTKKVTKAKA